MNGVAVLLCFAALGVDHNWRTTQEGQLEYVLQIEPTFLTSLEQGQAVTSKLPATAKEVHRLCLRIGNGDLRKTPQRTPEMTPLASATDRAAQREADIPVAVIVDGADQSSETTDVSHGWQAVNRDQVEYLVQLSPQLLSTLREGDEIFMNIYPEAGAIHQFTIIAGQNVLPRKGASARSGFATRGETTIAPTAAENPSAYRADGADVVLAAETRTSEPSRLRSPQRIKMGDQIEEQQARSAGPYSPVDERREPAPELLTQPAETRLPYSPPTRSETRSSDVPRFDPGQFGDDQYEANPTNPTQARGKTSIAPPPEGSQFPKSDEEYPSAATRKVGISPEAAIVANVAEEEQTGETVTVASRDSKGRSGITTVSALSAKPSSSSSTAAKTANEPKPWWPLFFTCCALFLSLGGNVYLGWTAAEFYSRYRLAVERMRGSGRDFERDLTRD